MITVDLHTHILPASWPDLRDRYGYGGWVGLEHRADGCGARMMIDGRLFREVTQNTYDPHVRVAECDGAGVDLQVLSTVPVMFAYWAQPEDTLDLARYLNNHIAEVVADFPRRFIGLGTVPLQDARLAAYEMERCVRELGLAGVQIGTHANGVNLGDPRLFEFFEAAQELDAAVFVHPWEMLGGERLAQHWLAWLVGMPTETTVAICSLLLGGVLERLPRLRIAFAHGGGSFPGTVGRIQHGFESRPDLVATHSQVAPREYLRKGDEPARFFVDSLVHDPDALHHLLDLFGAERVALGSDYPFPLGEHEPGALIRSLTDIDEAQRARLLGGSALEFLGARATAQAVGQVAA